ncbi:YbaY family lipoprotein [uncultured Ferrimonas sp.]|uniref:YbaY family lipoprotein n=1 Tax=uncultured Ferrimonas sp. TaxID=432640 RepID=UPI0026220407|nr:YbaY family lipoprotein [uncultured Ferrimonas sp.]
MKRRTLFAALLLLPLAACVSDTPQLDEVEYVQLSGVVTFKEKTLLPQGSSVTVAVIDANERGAILMRKEFEVAKLPVPFFLSTPKERYNNNADYVVWASIKVKGLDVPLLQTQRPFVRVLTNDVNNAVVEVKPLN